MSRYRKRVEIVTDGTYNLQSVAHEIGKDCRITDVFGCCTSPNDMRFQVDGCYYITPTDIVLLKDYPKLLQKDVHISFLITYEKENEQEKEN